MHSSHTDCGLLGCVCTSLQNYGAIGMLHTLDAFRQRGYARLCVDSLCRAICTDARAAGVSGVRPFCYIHLLNTASQKTFRALGFQPVDSGDFVAFVPPRWSPTEATH